MGPSNLSCCLRLFLLSTLILNLMTTSAIAKPVDDVAKSQADIRASLITKHNVMEFLENNRKQKQLSSADVKLPAPFIVSTSLNIAGNDGRRGRSYPDGQGNTIVEGVRVPDDVSDKTTYRNGRFINNVFVPADAPLPAEITVSTAVDEKKSVRAGKSMSDDDEVSLAARIAHFDLKTI